PPSHPPFWRVTDPGPHIDNRTRPDMKRLHASLLGTVLALGLATPAAAQGPAKVVTPSIPGASAQVLPDFADLVEKYGPAVVNINTQTRASPRPQLPGLSEDDPF